MRSYLLLTCFAAAAACSDNASTPAPDAGGSDAPTAADVQQLDAGPDAPSESGEAGSDADGGPTPETAASLPGQVIVDFDVQAGHVIVLSHGAWGSPTEETVTVSYGTVGGALQTLVTYTVAPTFTNQDLHVGMDGVNAYFTTISPSVQLLRCALTGCTAPEMFFAPFYSTSPHAFAVSSDGVYVASGNAPSQVERIDKVTKTVASIYTASGGHVLDSIEDDGTSLLAHAQANFVANGTDSPVLVSGRTAPSTPTEIVNGVGAPFYDSQLGNGQAHGIDANKILSCALAGCNSTPSTTYAAATNRAITSVFSDRGSPEHLVFTVADLDSNDAVVLASVAFSVCEAASCATTLSSLPGLMDSEGPDSPVRFDGGYAYWVDQRYVAPKIVGRETVLRAALP